MSSVIDICNLALGNVRAPSINSLDESSIEAQVCKQRYEMAVKYLLEDFSWNFAHKIMPLGLLDVDVKEWTYAYSYPNDCLKVKRIVPNESASSDRTVQYQFSTTEEYTNLRDRMRTRIPYEIGRTSDNAKAVFTDQPDANIAYTAYVADPNEYSYGFIDTLSWYLASVIAIPVVGAATGAKLRQDALRGYEVVSGQAKASNANERTNTNQIPESPTITARR